MGKRERLICVAIPSLVMRRPVSWDDLNDTVRETVFGMKKELSIDESVNVKFDYEII